MAMSFCFYQGAKIKAKEIDVITANREELCHIKDISVVILFNRIISQNSPKFSFTILPCNCLWVSIISTHVWTRILPVCSKPGS